VQDLIEVRNDERFDVASLTRWVSAQPGLPDGAPEVMQFAGGKANLTYLLLFPAGEELVLRRPPLGPIAESAHDMGREHLVLSKLWQGFDKAPRALAMCDDPSVIGSTFFVMERKPGVVVRDQVPEMFGGGKDAANNRKLSTVVIDTLVELHAVDPTSIGLEGLGHPDGFMERQVDGWLGRWERARHEDIPVADEVGGWLRSNLPASPDDPGRCVAVYDWDMATRGDPLADVGTLMASWYEKGEVRSTLAPMPTTAPGWLGRREALGRYGELSGRDLTHIDWYVVFGTWKLGVVLQQIYIRWLRGQTEDPRFEALGEGARALFRLASTRRP
jgi:aminoglycoside phosphotransferase (APT) family kinase protein